MIARSDKEGGDKDDGQDGERCRIPYAEEGYAYAFNMHAGVISRIVVSCLVILLVMKEKV